MRVTYLVFADHQLNNIVQQTRRCEWWDSGLYNYITIESTLLAKRFTAAFRERAGVHRNSKLRAPLLVNFCMIWMSAKWCDGVRHL